MKLVVCRNCKRERRTRAQRIHYEKNFCSARCMRSFRKNGAMNFYETRRWLGLRYEAIKRLGRTCALCKKFGGQIHVDHIKSRSKFPELELEFSNLQILCIDCNFGKSNIDDTDWRIQCSTKT